jgi:ATP-dependent Lon protease
VLIPEENVKDLTEIPDEIKNRLDIHPVRWIEQVLEKALERQPEPALDAPVGAAAAVPATPAAPVEEPTVPTAIMKH